MITAPERVRTDRGDSLIEILVSLAVLGIGITALMAGLSANASTSVLNRSQSRADAALTSTAEYVKSLPYSEATIACGAAATTNPSSVPRDPAFTITYGSASAFSSGVSCSLLKQVPLTVSGDGFTLTMVVVRRP